MPQNRAAQGGRIVRIGRDIDVHSHGVAERLHHSDVAHQAADERDLGLDPHVAHEGVRALREGKEDAHQDVR